MPADEQLIQITDELAATRSELDSTKEQFSGLSQLFQQQTELTKVLEDKVRTLTEKLTDLEEKHGELDSEVDDATALGTQGQSEASDAMAALDGMIAMPDLFLERRGHVPVLHRIKGLEALELHTITNNSVIVRTHAYAFSYDGTFYNIVAGDGITPDVAYTVGASTYIYIKFVVSTLTPTLEKTLTTIPVDTTDIKYFPLWYVPWAAAVTDVGKEASAQIKRQSIIDLRYAKKYTPGITLDADGASTTRFSLERNDNTTWGEIYGFEDGSPANMASATTDFVIMRQNDTSLHVNYCTPTNFKPFITGLLTGDDILKPADTGLWATDWELDHHDLRDIAASPGTCGDDHDRDQPHAYMLIKGTGVTPDRTRNVCDANMEIADAGSNLCIVPNSRTLNMASAAVSIDWENLILKGGGWDVGESGAGQQFKVWGSTAARFVTINDGTNMLHAESAATAYVNLLDGTMAISLKNGTPEVSLANASLAGYFVWQNFTASLASATIAGRFSNATDTVDLVDGTYAVNATAGGINAGDGFFYAGNEFTEKTVKVLDANDNTVTIIVLQRAP